MRSALLQAESCLVSVAGLFTAETLDLKLTLYSMITKSECTTKKYSLVELLQILCWKLQCTHVALSL